MMFRSRSRAGAVGAIVLSTVGLLAATGPTPAVATPTPAAAAVSPATVYVDMHHPLTTSLRPNSMGLSFEASFLSNDSLSPAKGNLAQLLKTLSPKGELRFGGNQMDTSTWYQPGGKAVPSWAQFVIQQQNLDYLNALSKQTGWGVELGTNLKNYDAESTAAEVKYASSVLGGRLNSAACGNEIDLYPGGRDWSTQKALWQSCADQIKPYAKLVGGEEADGLRPAMLDDVSGQLSAATSHWYPLGNCNGQKFNLPDLLTQSVTDRSIARISKDVGLARSHQLPYRITEGNSFACLRTPNAGNVYAASLWSVDELLLASQLGATGEDMHVPFDKFHLCSEPVTYTALCGSSQSDLDSNVLTANPLYYGMLTVGQVKPGQYLPARVSSDTNTRAYAVQTAAGDLQVIVVQKDAPGGTPVPVKIPGIAGAGAATTVQLSGPSYTATPDQITLQGAQVQRDGTFKSGPAGSAARSGDGYALSIPTGTATIVTIKHARPVGCSAWPDPKVSLAPITPDPTYSTPGSVVINGQRTLTVSVNNTTACRLTDLATNLSLPTGWSASPIYPTNAGSLISGQTFKARYRVTVPAAARGSSGTASASASYRVNGAVRSTSASQAVQSACNATGPRVAGRLDSAVLLCGSGQYVDLPPSPVSSLSDFTVSAWVNPTAATKYSRIFDFGTSTDSYMFLSPNVGTTMRYAITTKGGLAEQRLDFTGSLPLNTWSHVAVTQSGSAVTMYLNGTAVASSTAFTLHPSDLGATTHNWLGRSQYPNDPYLSGALDDVQIYGSALTADQVAALATGTPGAGTVANYRFDETSGASATDSSGQGRTGTIVDPVPVP